MIRRAAWALGTAAVVGAKDIEQCPGEGVRAEDKRCGHGEHRICAQILAASGEPMTWQAGSFWNLTGQPAVEIKGGDSLCISVREAAALVAATGCEQVPIRCNATDMTFLSAESKDNDTALASTHACLEKRCGTLMQGLIVAVEESSEAVVKEVEEVNNEVPLPEAVKTPLGMIGGPLPFLAFCALPVLFYHKTWRKWYDLYKAALLQEKEERSTMEFK